LRVGRRVVIRFTLTKDVAKSFSIARLTLTKGGEAVVETTLGLDRHAGDKKGLLTLTLAPEAIDGGAMVIGSREIKGQPLFLNFGVPSFGREALGTCEGGEEQVAAREHL
jgi:hypothetical protein